ncbi:hypothetical protein A3D05_03560 [Candidatus Gottesmanbacteria bacterium RIFCSPHIGHO2_02_FULL_40_24]|uniref:Uncharacterized protein n=1 Tax=Candidatus Gottesmanbacteria bacterium RIFCSPHIGHO2_01_FULL_40_15 TaxID=1798376 RepID=A0A1F5Z457_9BACT|nr:MAG: hypothetical protein A2777_03350 [Candidatus Gottesmanbacteria bacterium RIFCSPHIGHO2_01_FULL_40_15]OGG17904.1 MAG: hypothetical protein A3D05_03560 [Candidatus Gottesmanbacteria bacterium RIFCSPHIGHO2_02_FULL_40_24]OGG20891.1 MAG: hypothetical protein A3B48_05780 [Candidatus Gottesmanbacteria bacterium RIFCSPLOWO2_01_FULL_40_10]OGG24743.1 MAG: hypothetical protein A3E42_01725 [Candidatus Gottesmanbacteria bacterium RIFCSPHIGHO2_12_FULL_40_13]OGG33900.1 MAG: hypothetical protein A3I80_0
MIVTSVCIRCGKTRIKGKTWKEKVEGAEVTITQTVCPDDDCQKIVDEMLQSKKEKLEKIQKESLNRRTNIRRSKKPLSLQ